MKNELVAYLRNVQKLEGDLYAYDQSKERIRSEIRGLGYAYQDEKEKREWNAPELQTAPMPQKRDVGTAYVPSLGDSFATVRESPIFWVCYSIVMVIFTIVFVICVSESELDNPDSSVIAEAIIAGVIGLVLFMLFFFLPVWLLVTIPTHIVRVSMAYSRHNRCCEEANMEYQKALAERPRLDAAYRETFELEMQEYKRECKEAEAHYQKQVSVLQKTISDIESQERAIRVTLQKAYSVGIVYPKYHSLVPISMFLEYFESGRCETLEGHEGAYNIYEMELRQNIIISKLDGISRQMETVKERQYQLYSAIQNANRISTEMARYALEASCHSRTAAENSALTEHHAKSIADSTKLLAQIESEKLQELKKFTSD